MSVSSYPPPRARTIGEVVERIDRIVAWAKKHESRIGYFAALYRHVAVAFEEAIAKNVFHDAARMEALDVTFFDRYLVAFDDHHDGRTPTRSWQIAFDAANDARPITVQHLLLGMNAHINFDLGIAVADVVPDDELAGFHSDFVKMNALLGSLLHTVLRDLSLIWPALGYLTRIFGREEDVIINFSMRAAREEAWRHAGELAVMQGETRRARIDALDLEVHRLGRLLWKPGSLPELGLRIVGLGERGSVVQRIDDLLESGERAVRVARRAAMQAR